jgi:hypothetical protein
VTAPGVVNLALGKVVKSSGDENAGLAPANAVDGNLTTRWSSAFVDSSWLEVDLGSVLTVNRVVLRWENAYGTAYQIQTSTDEQNWTPVYTRNAGRGGVEDLAFATVNARYVRMQGISRATQFGYSLFEFEIYGANVPMIVTQPVSQKVATGSTAHFSVTAGGTGPFAYQWMRNGTTIAGATNATFDTAALTSEDNNSGYSVIVSNASGSVTSSVAIVTVTADAPMGPLLHPRTKQIAQVAEDKFGPRVHLAGGTGVPQDPV